MKNGNINNKSKGDNYKQKSPRPEQQLQKLASSPEIESKANDRDIDEMNTLKMLESKDNNDNDGKDDEKAGDYTNASSQPFILSIMDASP